MRRTGVTSSGTSCSCCPISTCTSPRCPAPCSRYRHRRLEQARAAARARRPAQARCTPGRAAATAARRRRNCTSTRAPGAGCPTTHASSTTSARPSPTTCGSTARRAGTPSSCTPRAPRCCCRSPASGRTRPPTTRASAATASAAWSAPTSTTTPTPASEQPGLDDNAYTNVTAAWVLTRTLEVLRTLPEPRRRELARAHRSGRRRTRTVGGRLPHPPRALPRRRHQPVRGLRRPGRTRLGRATAHRYGDIRRLDRILEAEGDTVNRYQASKQADVLMLGYLFSPGRTPGPVRAVGLPPGRGHLAAHRRLLPAPHQPRLHPQRPRPRLGAGPGPARRGVDVLPGGPRAATSPTSRAAPPARASTWAPWPAPSTSSSAD